MDKYGAELRARSDTALAAAVRSAKDRSKGVPRTESWVNSMSREISRRVDSVEGKAREIPEFDSDGESGESSEESLAAADWRRTPPRVTRALGDKSESNVPPAIAPPHAPYQVVPSYNRTASNVPPSFAPPVPPGPTPGVDDEDDEDTFPAQMYSSVART